MGNIFGWESLREKWPNTEFVLVRILKYRPEETPYFATFHAVNKKSELIRFLVKR